MTRLYGDDAELYDIAFTWDIENEAGWIAERLGVRSVLEPGCGPGRMLVALARQGLEVVGIDISPQMVELAKRQLGSAGEVFEADMTDFDLGRRFGGAVSPINTLLHLTPEELARHLDCTARHLEPGGSYLVQVGLLTPDQQEPFAGSHWEVERDGTKLKIDWVDDELDFASGRSVQRSRIEVLSGDRVGEVLEERHEMTLWTPEAWARAIDASPFTEVATYDGGRKDTWPRVDSHATGGLLWHQLRV
jgi:SAM-dependent methyltransferase